MLFCVSFSLDVLLLFQRVVHVCTYNHDTVLSVGLSLTIGLVNFK